MNQLAKWWRQSWNRNFHRYAGPRAAVGSRRFGERTAVAWTVWVQAGPQRMRCHTVDVSARGAKLRPRGFFPVGTPLQMEFIKSGGRQLRVSGVVWRAEADAMAVMFLGTIPRAQAALERGGSEGLVTERPTNNPAPA